MNNQEKAPASDVFGDLCFLLMKSPAHQFLFVNDFEWFLMPPLGLSQYYIFRSEDRRPLAFATWAFVNEEVDRRLSQLVPRLSPGDWRCGDIPWVIEWCAPFGHEESLLGHLKEALKGPKRFRMVGEDKEGSPTVTEL